MATATITITEVPGRHPGESGVEVKLRYNEPSKFTFSSIAHRLAKVLSDPALTDKILEGLGQEITGNEIEEQYTDGTVEKRKK